MATTLNSNTDLVNGNELTIFINNKPIAFAKTCDLTYTVAEVETTNKFSGGWKASDTGQKSWTVTSDFMDTYNTGATSFTTLLTASTLKTPITVILGSLTGDFSLDKTYFSGTANIASLTKKAEMNQKITCSITLNGTGELTQVGGVS